MTGSPPPTRRLGLTGIMIRQTELHLQADRVEMLRPCGEIATRDLRVRLKASLSPNRRASSSPGMVTRPYERARSGRDSDLYVENSRRYPTYRSGGAPS